MINPSIAGRKLLSSCALNLRVKVIRPCHHHQRDNMRRRLSNVALVQQEQPYWDFQHRFLRPGVTAAVAVVLGLYAVHSDDVPFGSAECVPTSNQRPIELVQEILLSQGILRSDQVNSDVTECEERGKPWSSHHASPTGCAPGLILFPENTQQVSEIMRLCHDHRVPVVPFGGGTSLEGQTIALPTPLPSAAPLGACEGVVTGVSGAGGTGAAAVEMDLRGCVSLDFSRMTSVLALHPADLDATVQAGLGYLDLNEQLRALGLWFPLDPGPGASIGGMCACRCSGSTAVRYGSMRENVLGLTAVLADGTVVRTGGRARKSSAGYDLTRLLVGTEGTLAVITEITLKLHGIPKHSCALRVSFPNSLPLPPPAPPSPSDAVLPCDTVVRGVVGSTSNEDGTGGIYAAALTASNDDGTGGLYAAALTARDTLNCGVSIGRCELLDDEMVRIINLSNCPAGARAATSLPTTGEAGASSPTADGEAVETSPALETEPYWPEHSTTLLYEITGISAGAVAEQVEVVKAVAARHGGKDMRAFWAAEERERIWRQRKECLWSAMSQQPHRVPMITDVCVPLSELPGLIAGTKMRIRNSSPRLPAPIIAHAGDGNFHVLLFFDPSDAAERQQAQQQARDMALRAIAHGGTCTGEHGVGIGKKALLEVEAGPGSMQVMRGIKRTLDPYNVLNPGKVLDTKIQTDIIALQSNTVDSENSNITLSK